MIALTREVPGSINRCELTHLARQPIDVALARDQHRAYEAALEAAGCTIQRLPPLDDHPDAVFVEDTVIVTRELAVLTRPGAESRRAEIRTVADALQTHRPIVFLEAPATLDGGDVLRIGRDLYVGLSTRTNPEGARQLQHHLAPHGYTIHPVTVRGVLHLKSAITQAADDTVLLNPAYIDPAHFSRYHLVEVHPDEPSAANVLHLGDITLCSTQFPQTNARLVEAGVRITTVDSSELAKAEAALTCCSVLVE